MVPVSTHPTWGRLIRGEIEHKFSSATTGLLLFNLRHDYRNAPETLPRLVERARDYFKKFEVVLAEDIKRLFQ